MLKEIEYVLAVLGVPPDASFRDTDDGVGGSQFARFAAVMALAERVCGLDESMRATIRGINARAMESRLNRAKNMFYCNDTDRTGMLTLEVLELELRAGCISQAVRYMLCGILKLALTPMKVFGKHSAVGSLMPSSNLHPPLSNKQGRHLVIVNTAPAFPTGKKSCPISGRKGAMK